MPGGSASLSEPDLVSAAERELRRHFDHEHPRLAHSLAVAECAAALAPSVDPADRALLVASALLHDLGYADDCDATGFHPVDGACYLEERGWSHELCSLVAHHSGARFVAAERGLASLLDVWDFAETPLTDALTAADQTIGLDGTALQVEERMREMLVRHGPDSPQARAHPQRAPYLRGAVARVEARLETRPVHHPEARGSRLARVPSRPQELHR